MKRDCTIRVAKTKTLISFAVTAKLICVFVFAYAKSGFSHNEAHISPSGNLYLFVNDARKTAICSFQGITHISEKISRCF